MASHLERVNFYFYIYFHDFTGRLMGSGWGIKFWHGVWGSQGLVFGSFCISEFYVVEYWSLGVLAIIGILVFLGVSMGEIEMVSVFHCLLASTVAV